MNEAKPLRIVVLGGGTAGWVSAAVLSSKARERGWSVTVIDTADIPTIGVGEASIPTIYDLLQHVGLSDDVLIGKAQSTFKYAIQFEGWSQPGSRYMHGFGNMGTPFKGREFFAAWLAGARYFTSRDLSPFAPANTAAAKGRFCRVANRPEGQPDHLYFPLCELSYALHFDAALLARELRAKALANGAQHLSRHIAEVEQDESGITALVTKDGERIEADFFVDCSGLGGFLARKTLGGAFQDWRKYLPCDGAIAVQTEREGDPNLFTRSIAHKAGWRWEIQLQGRTGNGCVFSSAHMSDDEAQALLMREISGKPITEPRKIAFKTGRMPRPWQKNCAAIGLSAGFLEPLESTSIHLICKYALALEKHLAAPSGTARDDFNAQWCDETSEIRDFLLAHYVVNQRSEDFWVDRREGPKTESLERRLKEFAETGWITLPEHALFGHDSWFQVLIGQAFQLNYDRFAVPPEGAQQLLGFLQNVARAVHAETDKIPQTHSEALAKIAAEAEAKAAA